MEKREFDALMLPHYKGLLSFAKKIGSEEPTDLVQETYLRAYKGWQTYNPEKSAPLTWLNNILHHIHVSERRKEHSKKRFHFEVPLDKAAYSIGVLPNLFEDEISEELTAILNKLPIRHKEVIELMRRDDHTYEMGSQALGVPKNTYRVLVYRAREYFKNRLNVRRRKVSAAIIKPFSNTHGKKV